MAKSPLMVVSVDPHCNSCSESDLVGSRDGHPYGWDGWIGWDGWMNGSHSVQTQPFCPEVDPFNKIF